MKGKLSSSIFIWLLVVSIAPAQTVTDPQAFFGFQLGSDYQLASWDQIVAYFHTLDEQSNRIQVEELGKSTQGNPFIVAIITSEQNMSRLGDYRAISRRLAMARDVDPEKAKDLIARGKTVVLITCSIHATEVGAAQMSSELAYKLITQQDPRAKRILDDVIFLLVPSFNPDGLVMVKNWYDKYLNTPLEASRMPWLYHLYTGHDNNRDAFMLTQVESRLVTHLMYKEWFPQVYLDMHQMGNRGARIFVPPFIDPLNPNIDPLVTKMNTLFGEYMATDLQAKGMKGIITGALFTSWWQGGFLMTAWWHNTIGVLTELASVHIASPIFQTRADLRGGFKGLPEYRIQVNFPDPWQGGWWRLRDIVNYDLEAALALLQFSSIYRENLLNNMYQMGKRAIQKGREEPPFAYVIPPHQRDPLAAQKMLDLMNQGGVEIHRATTAFSADEINYPKNSYVVLMAQPFRAYAKDLLEPQHYPDLREYQGGPPIRPYDVSGWTLPYQLGVRAVEVIRPFQAKLEKLDQIVYQSGEVARGAGFGYLLDARSTDSFAGVNRALKNGLTVFRTSTELTLNGTVYPPGSFVIAKKGAQVQRILSGVARELHLKFLAVKNKPAKMQRLSGVRLGVYQPWFSSMHEGWSRWVLENYEFSYKSLHNEEIRAGNLNDRYDVIYIPDINAEGILKGRAEGTAPPEFTRGIEIEGLENLQQFVRNGGVLITMDAAAELVMKEFALPVMNTVKDLKPKEFFCPGSILQIEVDTNHPVGYGMEKTSMAYFSRSSVFRVLPSFKTEVKSVVKYPKSHILKSGYLLGEKKIADQSAVVDCRFEKGRVILIGFDAINRAQAQNTFKILFNAIYLGGLR